MIAQLDPLYLRIRSWKLWSRLISYLLFEGRPLTTRGQWINPLLFAHFSVEKRLPQLKLVEKPVFILGTGRSGTTVLGVVLSMHCEVGFLNEPKALWHSIYPHEDLIGSYDCGEVHYRLDANQVSDEVRHDAHRLFGAYLAASFSHRMVDKYPELIFRVPFVKAIFPDAKFLFLVRNGWNTCQSIELWSNRLGQQRNGEVHDWWGVDRRKWNLLIDQIVPEHEDLSTHAGVMLNWTSHTDMAAVEWIVSMREGLKLLEKYPDDLLRVDYEKLCTNPREELTCIARFMSLEKSDEKFYRYAEETLMPSKSKPPFPLHPCLEVAFRKTMTSLGYVV